MRLFLKILLYVFTVLIANVDATSASITLPNIQETTTTLSFYGKTLKTVVGVIENDLENCCQNEQNLVDYRNWVTGAARNAAKTGANFADDVLSTATRTSTKYGNSVEVLLKNGNKMDINATRVKEWVPNLHPNAPAGTFQKVKFENFFPNSKGFKRTPTQSELDFLNSLFK